MTEETDAGAVGRFKDGNKIRFRKRLPQKLGGWILNSLGTEVDGISEELTQQRTANAGYSAGASTIVLDSAVTVLDMDPVQLFDDSVTGGLGAVTIDDPTALQDEFVFDLDAAVTATAGDAFSISYSEEVGGGANVKAGGVQAPEAKPGVATIRKTGKGTKKMRNGMGT